MADKKITDLTTLTSIGQNDLLVVVSDPSGTPITKKIVASSLFGNVTNIVAATGVNTAVLRSVVSVTGNAGVTGATMYAAEFIASAEAGAVANLGSLFAINAKVVANAATANIVSGTLAAAHLTLDVSNTTAAPLTNTFGVLVEVANTGARVAGGRPRAFIGVRDSLNGITSSDLSTQYLIDASCSANVAAGSNSNTLALVTNCASSAATHKARVMVNGVQYFLLLTTSTA